MIKLKSGMLNNNLKLADEFAEFYDDAVSLNNWQGPELIFNLLKDQLKNNSEILDLGIGTGESSIRFQRAGHKIIGLDGSEKMLDQCRKKKVGSELIVHNIEVFPFPLKNHRFDAVISNGVFHLIYPLKDVFTEVKRILKQGGIFAFTFENTDDISGYTKIESGCWEMKTKTGVLTYKYSTKYISELLKQHSFVIEKHKHFLAFTNFEFQKKYYFLAIVARSQPE